jgi:hypothetical protein
MDIVGERRLLKLAGILDDADMLHRTNQEPTYNQGSVNHPCGTPACAIGHWKRHSRGRIIFSMDNYTLIHTESFGSCGIRMVGAAEFRITQNEAEELFGGRGCDDAKTAKQAAKYIRKFVRRKQKEQGR